MSRVEARNWPIKSCCGMQTPVSRAVARNWSVILLHAWSLPVRHAAACGGCSWVVQVLVLHAARFCWFVVLLHATGFHWLSCIVVGCFVSVILLSKLLHATGQ